MKHQTKHNILKALSEKFFNNFYSKIAFEKGLTIPELAKSINCSTSETYKAIAPLLVLEELKHCTNQEGEKGLSITPKGIAALTDNKYINQLWDRRINISTKIIIPIFSLSIAMMGLLFAHKKNESANNIKSIQKDFTELKKEMDTMKNAQLLNIPKPQNDSISKKQFEIFPFLPNKTLN